MPLKQTEYTTIEITEDGEYGMVIGNIVLDKNKMLYAEIVGGTMCNHGELVNARAFLDEVDDAMNVETEPIIDEGCAGSCKVVDVAARMQKELDECNERCTKLGSHNMQITANLLDRKAIITDLRAGSCKVVDIAAKLQEELEDTEIKLVGCRKLIGYQDHIIRELRAMVEDKIKANQNIIEEYKETIKVERIDRAAEKKMINRKFCEDLRKLNATIEELKDELSARNRDSEVLKKVVDIAKAWGKYRDTLQTRRAAMYKIVDLVDDYLNAIEDSTDSGDNTSYTVEMGIRCE